MKNVIITIKKNIQPTHIIFKQKLRSLTYVNNKFIQDEIYLHLNEDKYLTKLKLNKFHPNCDPKTNEFCLPHILKERKADKLLVQEIITTIQTFNLDNCYYQPWKDINYE